MTVTCSSLSHIMLTVSTNSPVKQEPKVVVYTLYIFVYWKIDKPQFKENILVVRRIQA